MLQEFTGQVSLGDFATVFGLVSRSGGTFLDVSEDSDAIITIRVQVAPDVWREIENGGFLLEVLT